MIEKMIISQEYVLRFLIGSNDDSIIKYIFYGNPKDASELSKIVIVQSNFFNNGIYGTTKTIPKTPFNFLPESDIPFLFGDSKLEIDATGHIVLYADLIASAYYMLSRYEEIIKPKSRDKFNRFLAKDSIVFQQGYGVRPIVDEWGLYLRNLLRKTGIELPEEKYGFNKIYLTHDVDTPFEIYRFGQVIKQWGKNIFHLGKRIKHPFRIYKTGENDSYNTFDKIVETDSALQKKLGKECVESIYFLIAAGSRKTKTYCNILLKKFQKLIKMLFESGATLGLHVSLEAGGKPDLIKNEVTRLLKYCPNSVTKSRNHFLCWTEPEHIEHMELAGITEDFTLGYADSAGFRVGTCRPYYFINPKTKSMTNIIIHPMEIMECSLDRISYMGLSYDEALELCKKICYKVYKHNGELNILWHNDSFLKKFYRDLYKSLLNYIENIETAHKCIGGGVRQYSIIRKLHIQPIRSLICAV